jgi:hypothetical protein
VITPILHQVDHRDWLPADLLPYPKISTGQCQYIPGTKHSLVIIGDFAEIFVIDRVSSLRDRRSELTRIANGNTKRFSRAHERAMIPPKQRGRFFETRSTREVT